MKLLSKVPITAIVGVVSYGVDEVSFWACNAIGNLATSRWNRLNIIKGGGISSLLYLCSSPNQHLAIEAARALVMLT